MKLRKIGAVCLAAAGLCSLMAAAVTGYWKLSGSTGNLLTMGSFQNQITEEYQVPAEVNPGQQVDKIVNITNSGSVDSLIRVKLKKAFGKLDEKGVFQEESELDPEKLILNCNTGYWKLREDGFYYYKEILKAGDTTKEPLLTSHRLSEEAGNEYKGKEGRVFVLLESVQASGNAPEIWNFTYRDLGIIRPEEPEGKDTQVVFRGKSTGFDISESKTDLFAAFKELQPGCARTQKIRIENKSSEEMEFYLRAESAGRKDSGKTAKLVKELLEQHAMIEITGSDGKLYSGPVSGNLNGSGSTMKQDLLLGRFQPGEIRELTVKLSLSEKMDNEFCRLCGKVKWVFTAKGEDGEVYGASDLPKTVDKTEIGMWIALLLNSALCLTGAFLLERRYRRREEHESDERNS